MEYLIDMIHYNPGEKEFDTKFSDPAVLRSYGYNYKCSKHVNCAINFEQFDPDAIPAGSKDRAWIDALAEKVAAEVEAARKEELGYLYHIDLFVLPKKLVEKYHGELCEDGRISIRREMTKKIHAAMFDELFARFPGIDGLIIRIGETYLHDTPYHIGNGPVNYGEKAASGEQDFTAEKRTIIELLRFLREEVCVKHHKKLLFRTWDCFNDKLHANPQFYLDVTNKVAPHPNLLFSVKHTMLDFWRHVKFNDCLTIGNHRQVIEVQCQREYEGKGAYPDYVMNGVIDGFSELEEPKGIREIMTHPKIAGVYSWSRGGGWCGPYLTNEFWCDLNTYVLSAYCSDPARSEEEIFMDFAKKNMKLTAADAKKFRRLALLSADAVLKGRYCAAFDRQYHGGTMPACNWMRDDRLGGYDQLEPLFAYLYDNKLMEEALAEKEECCKLWDEIDKLAGEIKFSGDAAVVPVTAQYGRLLFAIIREAWIAMAEGYRAKRGETADQKKIEAAIANYDALWKEYKALKRRKDCPSLYRDEYLGAIEKTDPVVPGMGESIEALRKQYVPKPAVKKPAARKSPAKTASKETPTKETPAKTEPKKPVEKEAPVTTKKDTTAKKAPAKTTAKKTAEK